jgi:uncharacterized protein YndB with AHSA1/START domain
MRVTKSIQINASLQKIWEALVNPEFIALYLFGTKVITDWKVGSPIVFKGNWHGSPFEDKGEVIEVQVNSLLKYSYWSSVLGLADVPENYTLTTYRLKQEGDHVSVSVSQDNLESQPEQVRKYADKYWEDLLLALKQVAERIVQHQDTNIK